MAGLSSLIAYFVLGYCIPRFETALLLPVFGILFLVYSGVTMSASDREFRFWIFLAICFRLVFLFAVPGLSDDVYRFIWDGRLLAAGIHPFAAAPTYYIQSQMAIPGIDQSLYELLNSKNYFTIYPPIAQLVYWLAVKISPHSLYVSIITMRVVILVAEIGTIILLDKLLRHFQISRVSILLYALNPLVILELSGNLHFEGIMICFLLWSIYLLVVKKKALAAVAFSMAIGVKLLPLILLPSFLKQLNRKHLVLFYSFVALACIALFIPFYNSKSMGSFGTSLSYYFSYFEFNASIYYLVRALGYWIFGFNIIVFAGGLLGLVSAAIIFQIAAHPPELLMRGYLRKNIQELDGKLWVTMLFSLLTYFLLTTTLHPWYIITLLALSIFTRYRFIVIWTGTIFLTYSGYTKDGFQENLWITMTEYCIVLGYLAYELLWKKEERNYSSFSTGTLF